ncbi:pyridoxal-dependent decarboxylase conserved domain protein [Aspergillus avenaceus]|uniref:Pyridoxal-dependent decarboxylase conserved domain protein n=1 Tax=Aspergillus avenaceus TaxID=36643 RepID=A0A5N6TNE9_ASPAV|nr:pyridoxal-dependent decarboxylase conserved domain protein [Aspergillus avenaceus]
MTSVDNEAHQAICSYFIGPKAANLDTFRENITKILDHVETTRRATFYPEDDAFIPDEIRNTDVFKGLTRKFGNAVDTAAKLLGEHSVPFWTPRYEAHMCTDLSMVSMLGYFMTMIYNPNNVATEASPFSTAAEILVGEQLCRLLGYETKRVAGSPAGWGHVTCDGTVANLESIWVARNLKFYPLSLYLAIKKGNLAFAAADFTVQACTGVTKRYMDLSTWELLNLKPGTVLDLAKQLSDQYDVSPTFIEDTMAEFNIQTLGKDVLEKEFGIDHPVRYLLSNTRHYSWPKGGAIAGIGSQNMFGIKVDAEARVDLTDLVANLEQCLQQGQAVYAVVAIMGSTEEGAVDRLSEILRIRQRFQKRGLSFLVHADAAWGGYFASMLPRSLMRRAATVDPLQGIPRSDEGFVPGLTLKVESQEDLLAMKCADSITIDPHKAGYIPYPAGSLVYRDERMKNLVTWTSPYIGRGSLTNIGIYGVEGSKPGAAAMSVWLSNECIGLNETGYGALLGEAAFTSSRISAYWAALTEKDDKFVCVPLNRLPSEVNGGDVEGEKKKIREQILCQENAAIVDKRELMTLLRALGSDLNINAFALNWRYADGRLNDDIEEANYLMRKVVEKLSISTPDDDPVKIPFYLTSTEFKHEEYGACAENFMRRLAIDRSTENLMVLRNVVMSPFPTRNQFLDMLMGIFKSVVEETVDKCRERNCVTNPEYQNFLIQGIKDPSHVYLVYRPSFQLARSRRQLIFKVCLEGSSVDIYKAVKDQAKTPIFLQTTQKFCLEDILNNVKINNRFMLPGQLCNVQGEPLSEDQIEVHICKIAKNRSLNSRHREPTYPKDFMPFYLYGTNEEMHLSHVLLKSPNVELCAADVTLELDSKLENEDLTKGAILCLTNKYETCMQPIDATCPETSFFKPRRKFTVKVWPDLKRADESGPDLLPASLNDFGPEIASGTLELPAADEILVDSVNINLDPCTKGPNGNTEKWRKLFDQIRATLKDPVTLPASSSS